MNDQEQQDFSTENEQANDSDNTGNMLGNARNFLFLIAGLIAFMGIMVIMPMIFTYFSNGSLRP